MGGGSIDGRRFYRLGGGSIDGMRFYSIDGRWFGGRDTV